MLSLFDMALLMLGAAFAAWLWRGYGIREVALRIARHHCEKLDIELLDENVALRGLRLLRDSQGRRRLARDYTFEFTVTGDQRLTGTLTLFGHQLARIELEPHPFNPRHDRPGHDRPGSEVPGHENAVLENLPDSHPSHTDLVASKKVVRLEDWRREHPQATRKPH